MAYYYKTQGQNDTGRITLNDLKAQLYSLNRQILLAMQCHNEDAQSEIQKQIEEVQARIDRMSLGRGHN